MFGKGFAWFSFSCPFCLSKYVKVPNWKIPPFSEMGADAARRRMAEWNKWITIPPLVRIEKSSDVVCRVVVWELNYTVQDWIESRRISIMDMKGYIDDIAFRTVSSGFGRSKRIAEPVPKQIMLPMQSSANWLWLWAVNVWDHSRELLYKSMLSCMPHEPCQEVVIQGVQSKITVFVCGSSDQHADAITMRQRAADIKRMGVDKILWSHARRRTLLEAGYK